MNKQRIPEGTRDVLPQKLNTKRVLKAKIEKIFDLYGYDEIATPALEYASTYQKGFVEVKEESMYKFVDASGSILTLRMDMTIPIARLVSTRCKDMNRPIRFRYCSEVFKVKEGLGGKRSEVSDCGIELIGLNSEQSDLEVLSCAFEVLQTINKRCTLEMNDVNIFLKTCEGLCLDNQVINTLADLIDRKSMIELAKYVEQMSIDASAKQFFMQLPLLCGDIDVLKQARSLCINDEVLKLLDHLQYLYEALQELGYTIYFDLGKVPHLNYYSGIIFDGFVEGSGTSVLSGGRYDYLLGKFGMNQCAIGFSVKLDYILPLLDEIDVEDTVKVYYPCNRVVEALQLARTLRKQHRVEVIPGDYDDIIVEEGEVA